MNQRSCQHRHDIWKDQNVLNGNLSKHLVKMKSEQKLQKRGILMGGVDDRPKSNKSLNLFIERFKGVCDKELGCALGVANIDDLVVLRLVDNVVKMRLDVVLAHLVEGKVPELGVKTKDRKFFGACVLEGSLGASVVQHPDVISSF